MNKLLSQVLAGIIGLWLANQFVHGVVIRSYPSSNFFGFPLTSQWQIILVLGIVMGLLNYFARPILKALSLPLQIVTLGLFIIVINMGLLWLLDVMFDELHIPTSPYFLPLLYTTLLIWGSDILLNFFFVKKY